MTMIERVARAEMQRITEWWNDPDAAERDGLIVLVAVGFVAGYIAAYGIYG